MRLWVYRIESAGHSQTFDGQEGRTRWPPVAWDDTVVVGAKCQIAHGAFLLAPILPPCHGSRGEGFYYSFG